MRAKLRNCSLAEEEHKENIRYYAHTYHYKDTICVCKAFWDLPKEHRDGIIYHEFGHLLAGPSGSEQDANKAAEAAFGTKIEYVDSPYGKRLERLANTRGVSMAKSKVVLELRREYLDSGGYTKRGRYFGVGAPLYYWSFWNKETNDEDNGYIRAHSRTGAKEQILADLKRRGLTNPGNSGIEPNKWIPVHAVKFNENGSVSLLGEHAANPAKLGTGARFKALTSELAAKGARTPKALAAWIGRKKYGAKKFAQLSRRKRR